MGNDVVKTGFVRKSSSPKANFFLPLLWMMTLSIATPTMLLAKTGVTTHFISPATQAAPLNTFIQYTLANNPAVQAAEANVVAAQARQRAFSLPIYNPELGGSAQSAIEDSYSVGINQTVDWASKRSARASVGQAEVLVAEAQLENIRVTFSADILSALVAYQVNQQIVNLANQRTQLLQQFLTLTQKRLESGDVARIDVDLAQLALSQAVAQQADAEINLNQAQQALRALTGLKNAAWPTFPNRLPKLIITDNQMNYLLYSLPALQLVDSQYLSAEAQVHLAMRQRYSDPTFGVQVGQSKEDGATQRLIGVSVGIPLFVRNPYRAEVDAANADLIQASRNRQNLIRQTQAEIEGSAERYQILYQTTLNWQHISAKPLSDGMTLIGRLWQGGEINSTDYLVQVKQRVDSQIAGAELEGRAWQAWVAWLKASGQSSSLHYHF